MSDGVMDQLGEFREIETRHVRHGVGDRIRHVKLVGRHE